MKSHACVSLSISLIDRGAAYSSIVSTTVPQSQNENAYAVRCVFRSPPRGDFTRRDGE